MKHKSFFLALLTVTAVLLLSLLAVYLWGGKPEIVEHYEIKIATPNMTAAGIARQNEIPLNPVLKALGIDSARAGNVTLAELNIEPDAAVEKITKTMVLYDEQRTKNWVKILIKFAFWFILLPVPLVLLIRKKMNPKKRKLLYGLSITIIGVALGSDPSPMGTVKDAVFLITAH
ncbi:MAG: hypothetical protein JXA92_04955, partial [candidate division Zixibacteria bacterium]|nr:hypothetical protein [candidate division Zixibacteria bacterium]